MSGTTTHRTGDAASGRRVAILIGVFILAKMVASMSIPSGWEFHRDEFLYLALGRHPDWGYWSNGPMIGWIAWLVQAVSDADLRDVRWVPALTGSATLALTGWMTRLMGGSIRAVFVACFVFLLSPGFLRSGVLFQPVVMDVFWWTCGAVCLVGYLTTERPGWIVALGPVVGLGLLTKYSMIFFVMALFVAVLLTPRRRVLFSRPVLVAAVIATALFIPNLAWQAANGWPVVTHMRELSENQLVNMRSIDFALDQVLTYLPAVFVWVCGLFWLFKKDGEAFRAVGFLFVGTLVLLWALSGKSYYTMGVYPVLIAAGGVAVERLRLRGANSVAVTIAVVLGVVAAPFSVPFLAPNAMVAYADAFADATGLDAPRRWEDGSYRDLPQDYADMTGWREMALMAREAMDQAPDSGSTVVYAENYGQAGAIEHYGREWGLGRVISFADSYGMWAPERLPADMTALVYVNDEPGVDIVSMFDSIRLIGRVGNPRARERGAGVYLCTGPSAQIFEHYARRASSVRSRLRTGS